MEGGGGCSLCMNGGGVVCVGGWGRDVPYFSGCKSTFYD